MLCFWSKNGQKQRASMLWGYRHLLCSGNFRDFQLPEAKKCLFLIFGAFTHQWSIPPGKHRWWSPLPSSFWFIMGPKKTHRHFKLGSGSNRHVLLSQRCIITYQDAIHPYFIINWAVPTWWKPRITTELPRNLHTSQCHSRNAVCGRLGGTNKLGRWLGRHTGKKVMIIWSQISTSCWR